jgi:Raf kinase inhibitor-like YbhB/YbcL family protein
MERTGTHESEPAIAARRLGLAAPGIEVKSSDFADGQPIPPRHAGGHGRSPALSWSRPPPGTRELVILCEDPDAPIAEPFVHWILTGVPPGLTHLPEGLPATSQPFGDGAVQGRNDVGHDGYFGPEPPRGHGVHHYYFQLFAVDHPLGAPSTRAQLVRALAGHVLGWGQLVGTYQR